MALIRLEWHEHPAPPHHEIREKTVLDSGDRIVGKVANLYVDDDSRQLRFVDVLTASGLLGLEREHHLLLVEAAPEEGSGSITPGVDQQSVPAFPSPHAVPAPPGSHI